MARNLQTIAILLLALSQAHAEGDKPAVLLEQPLSVYQARRLALMKRVREAESLGAVVPIDPGKTRKAAEVVIVVVGETEEPEDVRYRQSNTFAYLTGVETPHAALILWPAHDKEVLYLPKRNLAEERWTGPKLGHGPDAAAQTGFQTVEPPGAFLGDLLTAIADPGKRSFGSPSSSVYLPVPNPKPSIAGTSAALSRLLREAAPTTRFKDIAPILDDLRTVKAPSEISLIKKAIALTADAQAAAGRLIAADVPEYRIEGAILAAFVGGGGSRAGFPSIVGSGRIRPSFTTTPTAA